MVETLVSLPVWGLHQGLIAAGWCRHSFLLANPPVLESIWAVGTKFNPGHHGTERPKPGASCNRGRAETHGNGEFVLCDDFEAPGPTRVAKEAAIARQLGGPAQFWCLILWDRQDCGRKPGWYTRSVGPSLSISKIGHDLFAVELIGREAGQTSVF